MNIQPIQNYNSTIRNSQNNQKQKMKNSMDTGKTYSQNFGIGIRGALNESIAQGKKILELGEKSPELVDMAESFHTCPKVIIEKVSAVYEWNGGIMNLFGVKDYNEFKSEMAYNKFSKAINNVINSKWMLSSSARAELEAKAQGCYNEYKMYQNF